MEKTILKGLLIKNLYITIFKTLALNHPFIGYSYYKRCLIVNFLEKHQ